MSFRWLDMRIAEEKERRQRDALVQERLPRALDELRDNLKQCVADYCAAFGAEAAEAVPAGDSVQVTVRMRTGGEWRESARVLVSVIPEMPGFRVERGGKTVEIEVGTLPGDKLLFKHGEHYLTMDQVTQVILDPALFPDLAA
ncbi:MAG TPA: hypothetical protein VMU19_05130 [Bryobacteraceae bacterium]|nr:hypothetical protein [Bryobacteraceae bacterium]